MFVKHCFCVVMPTESVKDLFTTELLAMLKKMLEDPTGTAEVKYSALCLICSLANSGMHSLKSYIVPTFRY